MTSSDMSPRRVVVTGIGAVTAAGWGVAAFQNALNSGRTSISPLTRIPCEDQRTHIGGEVPTPEVRHRWLARYGRSSYSDKFALVTALEAIDHAKLPREMNDDSTGVFLGTSTSGLFETERFYEIFTNGKKSNPKRSLLASHHLSAPAEAVGRQFRISGPVETISSACASAGLAIQQGFLSIADSEIDVAVTGGVDSLTLTTYSGFNALRLVDESPCRPLQADRNGMSLGEGGATLILEALDHASARGAIPIAEIVGTGASCDASHMTAPDSQGCGAAEAISEAISNAGLSPSDVDLINLHATGTRHNDSAESKALSSVFGNCLSDISMEATKGTVGHLLGAAGAIEAVSTVICLQTQHVHPTAGMDTPDPEIPIKLVRERPQEKKSLRYGLSSSFGFGGSNVAILFKRWEP